MACELFYNNVDGAKAVPMVATSESMAMLVRETAAAREVSPSSDDTLRMYSSRRLGSKACRLWDPIACIQYGNTRTQSLDAMHMLDSVSIGRRPRPWGPVHAH